MQFQKISAEAAAKSAAEQAEKAAEGIKVCPTAEAQKHAEAAEKHAAAAAVAALSGDTEAANSAWHEAMIDANTAIYRARTAAAQNLAKELARLEISAENYPSPPRELWSQILVARSTLADANRAVHCMCSRTRRRS